MRTYSEGEFAEQLKSSVDGVGYNDELIAVAVERGRKRLHARHTYLAAGCTAFMVTLAVALFFTWDSYNADKATTERGDSASNEQTSSLALTKQIAIPILERSGYTDDAAIALNLETGEAVLYVQDAGTARAQSVTAEIRAAVQATPGTAPIADTVGTSLLSELDELATQIFETRSEWATDPKHVSLTHSDLDSISVVVGVTDTSIAARLPSTMQLTSGATAEIRVEETRLPHPDNSA